MTDEKIVTMTTRMPESLVARVDAIAARKGLSRNAMINEMADSYNRFVNYNELLEAITLRIEQLEKEVFKK